MLRGSTTNERNEGGNGSIFLCDLKYIGMKPSQDKDAEKMGRSRNLMVAEHLAFKNDRHIRNVFEALNEQRQSARYTDTVLKIGLTEIKVHRCVLAAAIPKLLENQDREEKSLLTMNLEGLDPNAVEVLVEFAYTGELSVSAGEVLSLYHVAKSLGMREVQDSCEQFVREKVLPLDWMAVRGFAEQQDCPSLMIAVDKFIEQHVGEIYHKKDFFQLPRLQIELASTNDRPRESIDSEKLCNVAITWAHKQLEEGNIDLRGLLEKTHIMFLTADGELKECTVEDLDAEDEKSKLITTEAQREYIRYTSLGQLTKTEVNSSDDEEEMTIIIKNNNNKRKCSWMTEKDFRLIGAVQSSDSACAGVATVAGMLVAISIHTQTPSSCNNSDTADLSNGEEWVLVAPMSRGRCSVGAVVLNGKLYAVGGYDRGDCLNTAEQYDPQINEWMPVTNMNSPRGRLGAEVINGKIYAIGGSNGHTELSTVEVFDESTNTWKLVQSMLQCRCSFGTGVINEQIFAVGGYEGPRNLKSVEMYNPVKEEWIRVAPMNTERNNLCVEALDGKLYAIGGYNGWTCFNTVECYDPEEDHWFFVPPMKTHRRGAGVAVLHGKLYVIGGSDGTNFLNSVECYDPTTNDWKIVGSLNTPRHNVGAVAIGDHIYAVGGFGGSSFLKSIEYYDAKSDTWNNFVT